MGVAGRVLHHAGSRSSRCSLRAAKMAIFRALLRYAGHARHSDDAVRQYAKQLYEQIDIHRPHSFTAAAAASPDRLKSTMRTGAP